MKSKENYCDGSITEMPCCSSIGRIMRIGTRGRTVMVLCTSSSFGVQRMAKTLVSGLWYTRT